MSKTTDVLKMLAYKIFIIAVLVIILSTILLSIMQNKIIFLPKKVDKLSHTPQEYGIAFEDLMLGSPKINAWWIPKNGATKTIIFCHGNAGNLSNRVGTVEILHHDLNCNVLAFDYHGYGVSEGKVSEENCYASALTCYNYLIKEQKIKPENIIIHGRSLGGAIAADLASKVEYDKLILESTFASIEDVANQRFPFLPTKYLIRTKLDSLSKAPKLTQPTLLIHSKADDVVPYKSGKKLFDALTCPKLFYEIYGGHNSGWYGQREEYIDTIKQFLGL